MITQGKAFNSKIAGVTYGNYQTIIREHAAPGMRIHLVREPNNKHDPNAVAAYLDTPDGKQQIGYLTAHVAEEVSQNLKDQIPVIVTISEITGGGGMNYGVNIHISIDQPRTEQPAALIQTASTTINCPHCGEDIPSTSITCPVCRQVVNSSPSSQTKKDYNPPSYATKPKATDPNRTLLLVIILLLILILAAIVLWPEIDRAIKLQQYQNLQNIIKSV